MCEHKVFNIPFLKTKKEREKKEKCLYVSKGEGKNEIGLKVFNVPCLKTENTKGKREKKSERGNVKKKNIKKKINYKKNQLI